MGLDFSYLLYFHRDRLWDALDGFAAIADLAGAPTKVTFPDHIRQLPFTAWISTEAEFQWDDPKDEWDFMTSLCFPPDEPLEEFFTSEQGVLPHYVGGRIALGYIYLTVYNDLTGRDYGETDPDLVLFQFAAATTGMSILFTESGSIRSTFHDVLAAHGGVCGLIDHENGGVLTWWKGREVEIDISSPWGTLEKIAQEAGLD